MSKFLHPYVWGMTTARRIARLTRYIEIAKQGYKSGKMYRVQLPRYRAELEELKNGPQATRQEI